MGRKSKSFVRDGVVLRPCSICKKELPLENFYRTGNRYHSYCIPCQNDYTRPRLHTAYWNDPEARRKRGREDSEKKRRPKIEFANSVKTDSPCKDCGRKFPAVCMDFDHRPGTTKVADIAAMTGGTAFSLEQVKAEIEKCEVVCACCHRLRTQLRRAARASGSPK